MMMKIFKDALTEHDNETFSGPRMAAIVILVTFVGLSIADFIRNGKFDGQAYGLGAAATIAAVGAAIKLGERQ